MESVIKDYWIESEFGTENVYRIVLDYRMEG